MYLPSLLFCFELTLILSFQIFCLGEDRHFAVFFIWLPVFYAAFLVGKKVCIWITVTITLLVVLVEVMCNAGYSFSYMYTVPQGRQHKLFIYFSSLILNSALLGIAAWFYEFTREQAERRLEDGQANLLNARKELVDTAHRAGMSEIATGTLNNVSKMLVIIKTSSIAIKEALAISINALSDQYGNSSELSFFPFQLCLQRLRVFRCRFS